MRKNILQNQGLNSTSRSFSLFSCVSLCDEDQPKALLKSFLQTPDIKKLPPEADIPFQQFVSYLASQGLQVDQLLTEDYFSTKTSTAAILAQYKNESSLIIKDKTHLIVVQPRTTKSQFSPFNFMPIELTSLTLSFLDETSLAAVSRVNKTFNNESQHVLIWEDKLINAGCHPTLLKRLKKTKVVEDYKNLYFSFMQIPYAFRIHVSELWELLCLSGEPRAIKYAIQREGLTAETKNKFGDNALLYVASSGKKAGIKYISKKLRIDKNSQDSLGFNALLRAALNGNYEGIACAQSTLKIDPTVKTNYGAGIHHFVAISGDLLGVKYVDATYPMQTEEDDVTNDGETVFHYSVKSGVIPVIKHLMTDENKHVKDKQGNGALHFAAKSYSIKTINFIIKALNVDPANTVNNDGENIGHIMAKQGFREGLQYAFTELKLDPTAEDNDGKTYLHNALASGDLPTVKYLVEECKADPAIITKKGSNIVHFSSVSGNPAVVNYTGKLCKTHKLRFFPTDRNAANEDAFSFADASPNPEAVKEVLNGSLFRVEEELRSELILQP